MIEYVWIESDVDRSTVKLCVVVVRAETGVYCSYVVGLEQR